MSQSITKPMGEGVAPVLTPEEYRRLLSSRAREATLEVLDGRSGPVTVDELTAAVGEYADSAATEASLGEAELAVRLHHVELPVLDAMDVIDYNAEANTVERIKLPVAVRQR